MVEAVGTGGRPTGKPVDPFERRQPVEPCFVQDFLGMFGRLPGTAMSVPRRIGIEQEDSSNHQNQLNLDSYHP